jgi:hypothetical protein
LAAYESALEERASQTMHDLVLYLAWDRMCVWMARLFDYQSTELKFIKGIEVLKECLIESYQHMTQQGTSLSIYRMLEALFVYEIRQENLQKHTPEEWTTLSQSFHALTAQEGLVDFFYIDDAVVPEESLKIEEESSECYLILDSPDKVNSRLGFAQYMMDKLKSEVPQWNYVLRKKKIVYL